MQSYSQQQQQQGMGLQPMPVRIQEPNVYGENLMNQARGAQYPAGMSSMLTQAGASNFAQQMQQIGQQLQYLKERLHYAQNQVETQAQAQLRELQQIQQAIVMTMQQMQQAQMSANLNPSPLQ